MADGYLAGAKKAGGNNPENRDGANSLQDYGMSPEGWASYWKDELARRDKALETFRKRGVSVVKRYLDERDGIGINLRKFNILWSNVNTLLPAVFDERPKPIAGRRYLDNDPVARVAALMLERTLTYMTDTSDELASSVRAAVQDRLLPGVGTIWIRYDDGGDVNVKDPEQQTPVTNRHTSLRIDERAAIDFVQWSDFIWGPARTWYEVPYVARRVYMTRGALKRRFGEKKALEVPLKHRAINLGTTQPAADGKDNDPGINPAAQGVFGTGEVWEIWDKRTRTVTWLCPECAEPLDIKDDPLKFPDFWPCPKPLFGTCSSDKLEPMPDYWFYQDQAQELDSLTERIALLTKACKVVGVYDRAQEAVKSLLRDGFDNDLIPVDTWAAFAEKGGLKGVMDFLPLDTIIETLTVLDGRRMALKQDIYEITGLADIIRGASVSSETATAQRIKSQFANIRLTDLQNDVARFLTEAFRMMAHIVLTYFRDDTIRAYSAIEQTPDGQAALQAAVQAMQPPQPQQPPAGQPPGPPPMQGGTPADPMGGPPGAPPAGDPSAMGGNVIPMPGMQPPAPPAPPGPQDVIAEAIKLMRDSRLAEFRICVDDMSNAEPDIVQERQMRTEYLTALTQFLQQALPAAQQTPQLTPMLVSIMMWTLRAFRVGKDIEGQLEQALSQLQSAAQQGGQQKPDPEMLKAQAAQQKAEAEVKVLQEKNQLQAQKGQQDLQQDQQRFMQEMQQDHQRFQQEMLQLMQKTHALVQSQQMKLGAGIAPAGGVQPSAGDAPVNPLNGEGNAAA